MIAQCSKCGCEAKLLVTNTQTMTRECWECVAGPDEMMLRRVQLRTTDGYEVRLAYAVNNLVAVDDVAQGRDVFEFEVTPLPN